MPSHVRTAALLLAGLAAAAGCADRQAMYREVRESRARAYEAWRQAERREAASGWLLSGDLTLADALRLGLAGNKDLRIALEEQARAAGLRKQAHAEALPSLVASGGYTRLDRAPTVDVDVTFVPPGIPVTVDVPGLRDTYSVNLEVSQPLAHGGAIRAQIRGGEWTVLLADERLRGVVEQVIFDVAQAYYDVLLSRELYKVNETALKAARSQLDDAIKRREAGVATTLDVYRAQVEVANVQGEMIAQANAVRLATATLLKRMGASQQSEVTLVSELTYEPMAPVFERAVEISYQRRPDLYAAEIDVRIQQEALRLAKSRRFPFLDAFYRYTYAKPNPRAGEGADLTWDHAWRTGVNLSWVFFDGFRREGQIAEAEAALRQRRVRLADAEERAQLEVRQAILSIRDAEELIETQRLNVRRAEEALRLARVGYPQVTTLVEVNDALAAFVRAEGQYWRAVHTHVLARLQLQKAMGVLALPPGAEAAPTAAPVAPAQIPEFAAPARPAEAPGAETPAPAGPPGGGPTP